MKLAGNKLTDILVGGFIDDQESPAQFCPLYRWLFLKCGAQTIALTALGDTGRMRLAVVERVGVDEQMGKTLADEGMLEACTSLSAVVLRDADASNQVVSGQLWDAEESPRGIECAALRIELENGQQIFFDPSHHFGIRVGGPSDEAAWKENWPQVHTQRALRSVG